MGQLGRARRIRDDDRERARREIKLIMNGISDRELAQRIPLPGASPMPPPDELGISWALLWRAAGRPSGMSPEDGTITPGISDEENADVGRSIKRAMRPLLDRLEVVDRTRRRSP